MRVVRFVRFLVTELISLIADDPFIVAGTAVAIGAGALLGHQHGIPRLLVGLAMFVLVWATLVLSLWHTVRPTGDRR